MPDVLLLASLPAVQRLALAYAPQSARAATLALLALDARLAGIVRSAREPMLGQVQLAWWRDLLRCPAALRPSGELLVATLSSWGERCEALEPLVDGWESMLHESPLTATVLDRFADGRAQGFAALAGVLGSGEAALAAQLAARNWAFADLVGKLTDPAERAIALDLALEQDWHQVTLPRALRPLTLLHGLARRAVRRGGSDLLDGAGAMSCALRLGLLGR